MSTDRDQIRDTLRMPELALRALLNELDREEARSRSATSPPSQRPEGPAVIEVVRHNEGVTRYLGAVRRMTAMGAAVVHGVFLHAGTCLVHVMTLDGEKTVVGGRLTRCRYVGTRMHESQIEFDAPVDLSHYLVLPGIRAHPGAA